MNCTTIQNLPLLSFQSNDKQNFDNLIESVNSIPLSSSLPQDYWALAVVIQQEIEPIITTKDPEIKMKGNVLPNGFTKLKGFKEQLNILRHPVDPVILPYLSGDVSPLTESILVTRSEEKVNKISKVMFFMCRTDKQLPILTAICKKATEELIKLKDSMEGPFIFFAQAMFSDKQPSFSSLTRSSEPINLEIKKSFKELKFTLQPSDYLVLAKYFDHGEIEETKARISFALKDELIITTQRQKKIVTNFIDLRFDGKKLGQFYLTRVKQ
jgi:hypothetical protein